MQVRSFAPWSARSTYYLARVLSNQIVSGQDYQALKLVIGIHLLNFDLFKGTSQTHQAHWCFEMRDLQNPQTKLGDELQLHIIELPKADRLGLTSGHLAYWVALFEHWQDESTMQAIDYPPVQQALDWLTALSADAETRQLAKRFGTLSIEASQRLQSATPEQLERWLDRILDAPTLAAVFAEH